MISTKEIKEERSFFKYLEPEFKKSLIIRRRKDVQERKPD